MADTEGYRWCDFNYLKGDNLDNACYILGEFTAVGPHIEWIYDRGGIALIDKQGWLHRDIHLVLE